MFNFKNVFLLISASVLAVISTIAIVKMLTISTIPSYFISAILTGMIILIGQAILQGSQNPQDQQKVLDNNRESGTVKWFDSNKGYGFITRSMGEDIFVHFRSIRGSGYRSLSEGQAVEFLVTQGEKGPQAEDILIIK